MTNAMTPTAPAATTKAQPDAGKKATSAKDAPNIVTLDQLAREMKMPPAAKQTKLYPTWGKDHVARQLWQWTPGSKALEEARKALSTTPTV